MQNPIDSGRKGLPPSTRTGEENWRTVIPCRRGEFCKSLYYAKNKLNEHAFFVVDKTIPMGVKKVLFGLPSSLKRGVSL